MNATPSPPLYLLLSAYDPRMVPVVRELYLELSRRGECRMYASQDYHSLSPPPADEETIVYCRRPARMTSSRVLNFFIVRANDFRFLLFLIRRLRMVRGRSPVCVVMDEWSYTACVLTGIPYSRIVYYAVEQPAQLEYRKRSLVYGPRDWMVRRTMRRIALLVAPNRFRLRLIRSAFRVPVAKSLVMRNAAPLRDAGDIPVEPPDMTGKLNLLMQGRISPHTCQDVLFRMIETYRGKLRFVVAGFVWPGSEEERRLADYDRGGLAQFRGFLSHQELDRLRRDSHIGLVFWDGRVSRSLKYCEPNKLFELIAAGVPVICTPNPPLRELVAKFDIGWCLDDYDGGGMELIIDGILADPGIIARKRENCLAVSRDVLNFGIQSRPFLNRLRELAAESGH